ncbi:hypothetical protein ACTACK_10300 [Pseudomonas syringae]|uniref:hypothetical protein n=1 Tax=Pseudomonas syringae TaxID=317 RepID=UPI003F74D7BF
MSQLTYKPSDELGSIAKGDTVECLDRSGVSMGNQLVKRVGKTFVQTECGRQWTKDYGEWISEFRGGKPVSYPFPSIRKVKP